MFKPKFIIFYAFLCVLNIKCGVKDQANANLTRMKFDTNKSINTWVSMWNTYDLSMVDALFVTDTSVTYFSSEKEGLIKGIDSVRKHHEGFGFVKGGKVQENKLWLEDLHTQENWPLATVTGIWYFRRGNEDSSQLQRGPVTFVYVQKENEYRIAHVHFANYLNNK